MAFNGFPFGGFTMGATGPDGMDVSLDDMIKKVRLSFSALATRKRQLKRSFQEDRHIRQARIGLTPPPALPRLCARTGSDGQETSFRGGEGQEETGSCPRKAPLGSSARGLVRFVLSVRERTKKSHSPALFFKAPRTPRLTGVPSRSTCAGPDPPKAKQAKQAKKKAPNPPVTTRAKKRAAVKAVARGSSDKRAAVLAKKRGMSAAAVALADAGAKKAAAARPAVTKAKASKAAKKGNAVRVAKKVRVAAGLAATKRLAKGGGVANGKKSGGFAAPGKPAAKAFAPPAGTLRVSIINDLKTPPSPSPARGAGARGKVQSAAAQRKMSAERRQASGRGGKLAGARGASLASRLGQARTVKSPAGVAKKSKALGSAFPKGTAIAGKRQAAAGKAAKKRGNAKRR